MSCDKYESKQKSVLPTIKFINLSYIILLFVSVSAMFFCTLLARDVYYWRYILLFSLVEFSLMCVSVFFLLLKDAYKYIAAKILILFSVLTLGEITFLILNLFDLKVVFIVTVVFAVLCVAMFFVIRKLTKKMLKDNGEYVSNRSPLFHIVKRDDLPWWAAWSIRVATIIIAFILVGFLSSAVSGKSFGETYNIMFKGVFGRIFDGHYTMLWKYLQEIAVLLTLALALTPAFKMKFWNCGAEGQALMGGLASIICMIELGDKLPYPMLIAIVAITSMLSGALWAVIPALFKAWFNTNETLFTLMMNYIATQIIAYYVYIKGGGSNVINPVSYGNFPTVGNNEYFVNIMIAISMTVLMYVYLKYSKQGYEISVVGESQNTARYIGINVKKVIIRTMIVSGALCGVTGMMLVAGKDHSINVNTVGGQGFTAILISWLGQFNPFIMAAMTSLVVFLRIGVAKVADTALLNSSFSEIMVGLVILLLVGCEFFVNYSIKLRSSKKEANV